MKKLLGLLLFISSVGYGQMIKDCSPPGPYGANYIDFLAWYEFADDYTDNGGNYNGTNYGASITSQHLYFPASDGGDYVQIPAGMLYEDIDEFTISYRFYLAEDGVDENYTLMGDVYRYTSGYPGFWIFFDNAGGSSYFNIVTRIQDNSGSTSYAETSAGGSCQSIIVKNTWYHVVMIFYYRDASSTYVVPYIDGTWCGDGADTIAAKPLAQDGGTLNIGNDEGYDQGFREGGMIDDLMFWDYDLRDDSDAWDQLMNDPTTMPTQ